MVTTEIANSSNALGLMVQLELARAVPAAQARERQGPFTTEVARPLIMRAALGRSRRIFGLKARRPQLP